MKRATTHKLTDSAQSFLIDVDANPYDILHQSHSPNVQAWCRIEGYAVQRADGTWSLTQKGAQAVRS